MKKENKVMSAFQLAKQKPTKAQIEQLDDLDISYSGCTVFDEDKLTICVFVGLGIQDYISVYGMLIKYIIVFSPPEMPIVFGNSTFYVEGKV
jgi:hypothetical protein